MIKFTDKDLYELETGKFKRFLTKKLQTKTEYNQDTQYDTGEEAEDELEMSSVIGGDGFDFDSGDDGWGTDGGDGDAWGSGSTGLEAGDKSGVSSATDWKRQNWYETWLMSPLFIVKYVVKDITLDRPKKDEWEHILFALNKINVIAGVVAIVVMVLGLNSPFTPIIQLAVAAISFLGTSYALKVLYNKGIFAKNGEDSEEDMEAVGEAGTEAVDDPFGILGGGDDGFADAGGSFGGFDFGEVEDEEVEEEDEEEDEDTTKRLGESPIRIDDDDDFEADLLDVFAENNKYTGRVINDRLRLLQSLSKYIITNDRNFGSYKSPKERSIEYNNIAYALFKGLTTVDSRFETDEAKLTILSVKRSPLLYKMEVILPGYFKVDTLMKRISAFEDNLRAAPDDKEVSVLITFYQGRFIFKFVRFDSKTLVSLGDILRFQGDKSLKGSALEQFTDPNKGLPVLLGLQDSESPFVVDYEDDTSGAIVGGSGSGKSWLTFSVMLNFTLANSYDHVQFIIMDAKNAPFWKAFARLPHVLGYHHDINTFLDILTEVHDEFKRRQDLLGKYGAEDLKGLRKSLKRKGDYETLKKFPLLIVIMDEITATMLEYENMDDDKETFNEVRNLLGIISAKGRSAGVRLLTIGQRSIDKSLPKTLAANSSFRFGMKMDAKSDFKILFGDEVEKMKKPDTTGMGLVSTFSFREIYMIKTLTIGGKNNEQMLALIRVLAFEWLRRAKGNVDLNALPEGMQFNVAFNRPDFYRKSIEELRDGRILNEVQVSKGYEVDLLGEGSMVSQFTQIPRQPVAVNEDIKEDVVSVPKVESTKFVSENNRVVSIDDYVSNSNFVEKAGDVDDEDSLVFTDGELGLDEGNFRFGDEVTDENPVVNVPFEVDLDEDEVDNHSVSDNTKHKTFDLPDMGSINFFDNDIFSMEDEEDEVEDIAPVTETVESKLSEKEDFAVVIDRDKEDIVEKQESKIQEKSDTDFFLDDEYGSDTESLDSLFDGQEDDLGYRQTSEMSGSAVSEVSEIDWMDDMKRTDIKAFSEKDVAIRKLHLASEVSISPKNENPSEVLATDNPPISENYVADSRSSTRYTEKQNTQISQTENSIRNIEKQETQNMQKEVVLVGHESESVSVPAQPVSKQADNSSLSETKKTVSSPAQIEITHRSSGVTRNEEVQESIESYIMKYGTQVDAFTYSIPKEKLEEIYTARKIKDALNLTLIFDDGDVYTVEV
ncbi:MAG: FtsK/SpoIIIE domain-containing protein [Bacillus sp. (in: firmicutes)]